MGKLSKWTKTKFEPYLVPTTKKKSQEGCKSIYELQHNKIFLEDNVWKYAHDFGVGKAF